MTPQIKVGIFCIRSTTRWAAVWALVSFVFTNFNPTLVYAAVGAGPRVSPSLLGSDPLGSDPSIRVPENWGHIQEHFQGKNPSTVILIQDAHSVPDAQKSIQKLIQHLRKKYGIPLVTLEGAASELDPTIFRSFPDTDLLRQVFEEYMERGELTGVSAAALFSDVGADPRVRPVRGDANGSTHGSTPTYANPSIFRGIEDWEMYLEGLRLYRAAMEKEGKILDRLKAEGGKLKAEKEKFYAQVGARRAVPLQEIDEAMEKFYDGKMNLVEAVKQLRAVGARFPRPLQADAKGAETAPLQLKPGPALSALIERLEHEPPVSLEMEVKRVARSVGRALRANVGADPRVRPLQGAGKRVGPTHGSAPTIDGNVVREFNARLQQYRTSQITAETFALYLDEMIKKYRLRINVGARHAVPLLHRAIRNEQRLQNIQGTELFEEFEEYAEGVMEALLGSDPSTSGVRPQEEAKALHLRTKHLRLLTRLAKLELSRKDWEEVKKSHVGADPRVRPMLGNANGSTHGSTPTIDVDLSVHIAFYRNAEAREEAMYENLVKYVGADPRVRPTLGNANGPTHGSAPTARLPHSTILVAGGFHTEGLIQRFKEQGISYVLVMPRINDIPEQTNYRAQMRGDFSWKDYYRVENGRVNVYEAFVRATRNKLLGMNVGADPRVRPPLTLFGTTGSVRTPKNIPDRISQSKEHPWVRPLQGAGKRVGPTHGSAPTLKQWRDQTLRDLAAQNRLADAGRYTRFLDEITDVGAVRERPLHLMANDREPSWVARIETFLQGLKRLESQKQLSQPRILDLLRHTTPTEVGAVFDPNASWAVARPRTFSISSKPFPAGKRSEARFSTVKEYLLGVWNEAYQAAGGRIFFYDADLHESYVKTDETGRKVLFRLRYNRPFDELKRVLKIRYQKKLGLTAEEFSEDAVTSEAEFDKLVQFLINGNLIPSHKVVAGTERDLKKDLKEDYLFLDSVASVLESEEVNKEQGWVRVQNADGWEVPRSKINLFSEIWAGQTHQKYVYSGQNPTVALREKYHPALKRVYSLLTNVFLKIANEGADPPAPGVPMKDSQSGEDTFFAIRQHSGTHFSPDQGFFEGVISEIHIVEKISLEEFLKTHPEEVLTFFYYAVQHPEAVPSRDFLEAAKEWIDAQEDLQKLRKVFQNYEWKFILKHIKSFSLLWEIHEAGILKVFYPDLAKVEYLYVGTAHRLPVGIHTLYVAKNLMEVIPNFPPTASLLAGPEALPQRMFVLLNAAFLHDAAKDPAIGRAHGEDHSIFAAEHMVLELAKTFARAATPKDIEDIQWVVRNHPVLIGAAAAVSEKEDVLYAHLLHLIRDSSLSLERLELLYLFTYADHFAAKFTGKHRPHKQLDDIFNKLADLLRNPSKRLLALRKWEQEALLARGRILTDMEREVYGVLTSSVHEPGPPEKIVFRFDQLIGNYWESVGETGPMDPEIKAAISARLSDPESFSELMDAYSSSLRTRYLEEFSYEEAAAHLIHLAHLKWLKERGQSASLVRYFFRQIEQQSFLEIFVGHTDADVGLFYKMAAIVAAHRLNLNSVQVSTIQGMSFNIFQISMDQNPDGKFKTEIRQNLEKGLAPSTRLEELRGKYIFLSPEKRWLQDDQIGFEPDRQIGDQAVSVMVLQNVKDRVGFLRDMAGILSGLGVSIVAVDAATFQRGVSDRFYLIKDGKPLDLLQQAGVKWELTTRLPKEDIFPPAEVLALVRGAALRSEARGKQRKATENFGTLYEHWPKNFNEIRDLYYVRLRGNNFSLPRLAVPGNVQAVVETDPSKAFKRLNALQTGASSLILLDASHQGRETIGFEEELRLAKKINEKREPAKRLPIVIMTGRVPENGEGGDLQAAVADGIIAGVHLGPLTLWSFPTLARYETHPIPFPGEVGKTGKRSELRASYQSVYEATSADSPYKDFLAMHRVALIRDKLALFLNDVVPGTKPDVVEKILGFLPLEHLRKSAVERLVHEVVSICWLHRQFEASQTSKKRRKKTYQVSILKAKDTDHTEFYLVGEDVPGLLSSIQKDFDSDREAGRTDINVRQYWQGRLNGAGFYGYELEDLKKESPSRALEVEEMKRVIQAKTKSGTYEYLDIHAELEKQGLAPRLEQIVKEIEALLPREIPITPRSDVLVLKVQRGETFIDAEQLITQNIFTHLDSPRQKAAVIEAQESIFQEVLQQVRRTVKPKGRPETILTQIEKEALNQLREGVNPFYIFNQRLQQVLESEEHGLLPTAKRLLAKFRRAVLKEYQSRQKIKKNQTKTELARLHYIVEALSEGLAYNNRDGDQEIFEAVQLMPIREIAGVAEKAIQKKGRPGYLAMLDFMRSGGSVGKSPVETAKKLWGQLTQLSPGDSQGKVLESLLEGYAAPMTLIRLFYLYQFRMPSDPSYVQQEKARAQLILNKLRQIVSAEKEGQEKLRFINDVESRLLKGIQAGGQTSSQLMAGFAEGHRSSDPWKKESGMHVAYLFTFFMEIQDIPALGEQEQLNTIYIADNISQIVVNQLIETNPLLAAAGARVGNTRSHWAINAKGLLHEKRDMGLVVIPGVDALKDLQTGDVVIVDGPMGRLIVNPEPELIRFFAKPMAWGKIRRRIYREAAQAKIRSQKKVSIKQDADGTRDYQVTLLTDVGRLRPDASLTFQLGSDGIGLYRIENKYMQQHEPTEEELFREALETADQIPGPLMIRTLDMAPDKLGDMRSIISKVLKKGETSEPRFTGVRFYFEDPKGQEIIRTQLRAFIRAYVASAQKNIKIFIPMVQDGEQAAALGRLIQSVKEKLIAESKIKPEQLEGLEIGAMIETPQAAEEVESILKTGVFNFVSVGTNDLARTASAGAAGLDRDAPELERAAYQGLNRLFLKAVETTVAGVDRYNQTQGDRKIPIYFDGEYANNRSFLVNVFGLAEKYPSFKTKERSLLLIPVSDSYSAGKLAAVLGYITLTDAHRVITEVRPGETVGGNIAAYLREIDKKIDADHFVGQKVGVELDKGIFASNSEMRSNGRSEARSGEVVEMEDGLERDAVLEEARALVPVLKEHFPKVIVAASVIDRKLQVSEVDDELRLGIGTAHQSADTIIQALKGLKQPQLVTTLTGGGIHKPTDLKSAWTVIQGFLPKASGGTVDVAAAEDWYKLIVAQYERIQKTIQYLVEMTESGKVRTHPSLSGIVLGELPVSQTVSPDTTQAQSYSATSPQDIDPGKHVILVVDDEDPIRELIIGVLRRKGFQVVDGGANGEQALRAIDQMPVKPSVIISDVMMGPVDGLELIDKLAEQELFPKVLFVSGYNTADQRFGELKRKGELGTNIVFLPKPFALPDMLKEIETLLAKSEARAWPANIAEIEEIIYVDDEFMLTRTAELDFDSVQSRIYPGGQLATFMSSLEMQRHLQSVEGKKVVIILDLGMRNLADKKSPRAGLEVAAELNKEGLKYPIVIATGTPFKKGDELDQKFEKAKTDGHILGVFPGKPNEQTFPKILALFEEALKAGRSEARGNASRERLKLAKERMKRRAFLRKAGIGFGALALFGFNGDRLVSDEKFISDPKRSLDENFKSYLLWLARKWEPSENAQVRRWGQAAASFAGSFKFLPELGLIKVNYGDAYERLSNLDPVTQLPQVELSMNPTVAQEMLALSQDPKIGRAVETLLRSWIVKEIGGVLDLAGYPEYGPVMLYLQQELFEVQKPYLSKRESVSLETLKKDKLLTELVRLYVGVLGNHEAAGYVLRTRFLSRQGVNKTFVKTVGNNLKRTGRLSEVMESSLYNVLKVSEQYGELNNPEDVHRVFALDHMLKIVAPEFGQPLVGHIQYQDFVLAFMNEVNAGNMTLNPDSTFRIPMKPGTTRTTATNVMSWLKESRYQKPSLQEVKSIVEKLKQEVTAEKGRTEVPAKRSETRQPGAAQDLVQFYQGEASYPAAAVAGRVTEAVHEAGVSRFAEIVRAEMRYALESRGGSRTARTATLPQITPEMAETANRHFINVLIRSLRGSVLMAFDQHSNPGVLRQALREHPEILARIGLALTPREMPLNVRGLNQQTVRDIAGYRPHPAFPNSRNVAVVGQTVTNPRFFSNLNLFYLGVDPGEVEGEPFLEETEAVVQLVAGALLSARSKQTADLKKSEIRAELLKDLFVGFPYADQVIRFRSEGRLITVDRTMLAKFAQYLAQSEIRKSA